MIKWIEFFLPAPSPEVQERIRSAGLVKTISVVAFLSTILAAIPQIFLLPGSIPVIITILLLCWFYLVAYRLASRGNTWLAGFFTCTIFWLVTTVVTFPIGGLNLLGLGGYIIVIIIASLLYGNRAGLSFFALSLFTALGFSIAEVFGLPIPDLLPKSRWFIWTTQLSLFIAAALLLQFAFRVLQDALERAHQDEHRLKRRAVQIQVAAEVARDVAAVREMDMLLNRAIDLIRERFGFYHAGIFLIDEHNEYAVLKAATGETGQKMLRAGHKLQVGAVGIVGYTAGSGQPRIALDVGQDAVHFKNPFLPETRSEMALPLKVGERVIGVLDVQSQIEAAFDDEDVAVLQTLADQLAIAFETARLFEAAQRQLRELTILHSVAVASAQATSEDEVIEQATQIIHNTFYPDNFGVMLLDEKKAAVTRHISYRENPGDVMPSLPLGMGITGSVALQGKPWRIADVSQESAYVSVAPDIRSELCVPLKAGERILGVINAESTQLNFFSEADERLLSTLASQLATGIQKVRLYEASQRQLREFSQLLEASEAVSSSLDIDTVLQITAQQVVNALGTEGCVISLLDNQQDTLSIRLTHSKTPDWTPEAVGVSYKLVDYPTSRQVVLEHQPVVVQASDPQADIAERDRMACNACQSLLMLPLMARGQVLGVLEVLSTTRERTFTADEIGLCQTMVNHMAVALENARLFQAERSRSAELEALRQASLRLTSRLELQPVLETILEQALALIPAANAQIFLYDGEKLNFGAAMWAKDFKPEPIREPRPQGLTYTVARWGKRIAISDISKHPIFHDRPMEGAIIGMPLYIGEQVLGVMNIAFNTPYEFDVDELRILELLADQASLALSNARMYTQAQDRACELVEALTRLQELDRMKSEFIQNASHELRTPLAIIQGYAELLASGDLGELAQEQQGPIQIMTRRLRTLTKLLEDLMTIVEAEAHTQTRKLVDLGRLLYATLSEAKGLAAQSGLEMQIDISPDLPLIVGIPSHLRRVFDNLIGNALKFTLAGGQVRVHMYKEDRQIILEVSDTGIGIPPEQVEHIFERFYQVDGSTTRRYGGAGLGLALVKEVIEDHGGMVSTQSTPDQGSTFQIMLPIP